MPQVDQPISYREYMQLAVREDARHERAINRLKARLKARQVACPHNDTEFQGDPAGGNDSCIYCKLCNKVL